MNTLKHIRIVTLFGRMSVETLATRGSAIVAAVSANPTLFPSPTIPLAQVSTAIETLVNAHTVAQSGAVGTVAARDTKLTALLTDLRVLVAYVQSVADAAGANAVTVIEAAGLSAKATRNGPKPPISAKMGTASGMVVITGRAQPRDKRAFYDWQVSVDGQKSWSALPSTTVAKTTVANLPFATVCAFRYRINTKSGAAPWSDAVTLLVHEPSVG